MPLANANHLCSTHCGSQSAGAHSMLANTRPAQPVICLRKQLAIHRRGAELQRSEHTVKARGSAQPETVGQAENLKARLSETLRDQNRGIFGTTAATKQQLEQLLCQLEQLSQVACPAQDLTHVGGRWRLLYTSLTIKGARKTKLGLRQFVTLGNFEQNVDVTKAQAVNRVYFNVTGLGNLAGSLTITARFASVSSDRVSISFENAVLVPKALEQLFASNYDMLLSIFNPEGWLDITYVDSTHRVGRDDKGNVYYLQRS